MTILERIVETKRAEVAAAKQRAPLPEVSAAARDTEAPRDLAEALMVPPPQSVHLIAECKKASPSAGVLRDAYEPAAIAREYQRGGASAISVLTDETYFLGALEHIAEVKQAVRLPVLRKDFIFDEYQVFEARMAGADAILLIAELLDDPNVSNLADLAEELGMAALIEVHGAERLDSLMQSVSLLPSRRRLLGINNRDLHRQVTDVRHTRLLTSRINGDILVVSESGVHNRSHVEQVVEAGAHAILIGEALLRTSDPVAKMRELFGTFD